MPHSENWSLDSTNEAIALEDKKLVAKAKKNSIVKERLRHVKVLDSFGNVVRVINYKN